VISPLALEAVRRIDELFEIERAINGQSPERRKAVRQELSAPLSQSEAWIARTARQTLARQRCRQGNGLHAQRWMAFTRFLDDGRICCRTMPLNAVCAVSPWEKILVVLRL